MSESQEKDMLDTAVEADSLAEDSAQDIENNLEQVDNQSKESAEEIESAADIAIDMPVDGEIVRESTSTQCESESVENIDFDSLMKGKSFSLFCKRCFDIVASFFGILFLSPVLLICSIAIAVSSRGGVFFTQERVGKGGKSFKIIKFRTMVPNAESKGMQITVGNDMRVTKVGKFLRKTKLDELPQLFNVLVGQMSFVGPRPEVPRYVDMYTEYQRNVLRIRPGITELASIVYRDENEVLAASEDPERTYVEEVMQQKLKLNMQYMQKMGFWYDIKLIFQTFLAILK